MTDSFRGETESTSINEIEYTPERARRLFDIGLDELENAGQRVIRPRHDLAGLGYDEARFVFPVDRENVRREIVIIKKKELSTTDDKTPNGREDYSIIARALSNLSGSRTNIKEEIFGKIDGGTSSEVCKIRLMYAYLELMSWEKKDLR